MSKAPPFLILVLGATLGLGDLWRFPALVAQNGGGAFLALYIPCLILMTLPIMYSELRLSSAQSEPRKFFLQVSHGVGRLSALIILAFYSVICGWVFYFATKSLLSTAGLGNPAGTKLNALITSAQTQWPYFSLFILTLVLISAAPPVQGVLRWTRICLSLFFILMLLLLLYASFQPGFAKSVGILFMPDFEQLNQQSFFLALQYAFFSFSLSTGAILLCGRWRGTDRSWSKDLGLIACLDTLTALLAGVIIFTLTQSPGAGPQLVFTLLPANALSLPLGKLAVSAFHLCLLCIALASALALFNVITSYWQEKFKVSRLVASITCGLGVYALGTLCLLSFSHLADHRFFDLSFFEFFDYLSSRWLLLLSGLLMTLGFAWQPLGLKLSTSDKMLMWLCRVPAVAGLVYLLWMG